jgi:hypothetical protein
VHLGDQIWLSERHPCSVRELHWQALYVMS